MSIEEIESSFKITDDIGDFMSLEFLYSMKKSLSEKNRRVFINDTPVKSFIEEKINFILFDIGGSFAKARIFNHEKKLLKSFSGLISFKGKNVSIFKYIGFNIHCIASKNSQYFEKNTKIPLILSFSYPINKDDDGKTYQIDKSKFWPFSNDFLGIPIAEEIERWYDHYQNITENDHNALSENNQKSLKIISVNNDSVSAILSHGFSCNDKDSQFGYFGVVAGTGSNMSYWNSDGKVINTEWSKFNCYEIVQNKWDFKLHNQILSSDLDYTVDQLEMLSAKRIQELLNVILNENGYNSVNNLSTTFSSIVSDEGRSFERRVLEAIIRRNAKLTAIFIRSISKTLKKQKVAVAFVGSIFLQPTVQNAYKQEFEIIFGKDNYELSFHKDCWERGMLELIEFE